MTTAPVAYAPSMPVAPSTASHRLLLWLPVPVALAVAFLLIRGDAALTSGVADLDPLYGLATLFIGVVCAVSGVVSLVLAVVFSFLAPSTRAGGSLGGALWSSITLVGLTVLVAWGSATDGVLEDSTTFGAQYPWQVAALVVALLPVVAVLVARSLPTGRTSA